ncbi:GntR family transcriptional regulator [Tsukamurella sp. PLM1]|uniref:GntR family transcriptional regulator n=1 Tax=Tsukamurella sp. PLM1 TaxID=2929795 RepID=UPI00206C2C94|nr:GntR family transcriptional regulator [Tsukamurella sp. PLM1]BDH55791.1 GntR family transcriptional regulator [Tsukamurella sp. PLM1]
MARTDDLPVRGRTKRRQLPEEVAGYVREQIMSGNMRPGEFLRMEPIAEAIGVSITPVREGLLTLRSEGFVTLVPRRGFQVAEFTRQDVRDLFWAQGQLAGELAARAAKAATPELLDRLAQINERTMAAAAAGDTQAVGDLGHAFHREINLAADSDRLARLLAGVVKHLPNQFYASLEAHVEATRLQHIEILDALKARDSRKVRKLMEAHLVDSADHVIALLEQAGLWVES